MALRWKSDGSGYTWTPDASTAMPASARAQAGAFYAVHSGQGHICPRCGVQVTPDGRGMCGPCEGELRRVVRVTARGGDAYENEQAEGSE